MNLWMEHGDVSQLRSRMVMGRGGDRFSTAGDWEGFYRSDKGLQSMKSAVHQADARESTRKLAIKHCCFGQQPAVHMLSVD